jgi:hypothetical protein
MRDPRFDAFLTPESGMETKSGIWDENQGSYFLDLFDPGSKNSDPVSGIRDKYHESATLYFSCKNSTNCDVEV